jgi:putative DNA primase/helicase
VPHGVKDASTAPETIRRWWGARPDASVGIATGSTSGFDVLDVDGEEGEDALRDLERSNGELPETIEALTGGGGRHILFKHQPGLRNAVRFAPGLDVRTDGGYIVASPSVHDSGQAYEWEAAHDPDETTLAPWPAWLMDLIRPDVASGAEPPRARNDGGPILDGQRNAQLASLAGTMRKRSMTESEILAGLREVNARRCRPPLDEAEVARVARSISAYQPELSVDELLDEAGFGDLEPPVTGAGLEAALENLAARMAGVPAVRRAVIRETAMQRLKAAGVSSPAKTVDAALWVHPPEEGGEDNKQGKALSFKDPDPWTAHADGGELLDGLVALICKYVVLPLEAAQAVALWVLHTYTWREAADFTPRLGITGPAKRCGKSRLLEVLSCLVCRALMTANVTSAVLFRSIEAHGPTLLVDEGDTFLRDSEELRGVLNAGQRRGQAVMRAVGEDHEPRAFDVFAPVAIALIGALPDTIRDRAILVPMRRRTRVETVARLRWRAFGRECEPLRRQAARWAEDHAAALGDAEPALPTELDDRAQDGWEPLLAIADAAGGVWPDRARNAALVLSESRDEDEASASVRLLADIRTAFEDCGADRLPTAKLKAALLAMEDRPWKDWRQGREITPRKIAELLRPFGIVSRSVRMPDGKTPKGYLRADCEDAFARYLPSDTRHDATEAVRSRGSAEVNRNTHTPVAADGVRPAASNGACGGVADSEAVSPGARVPETPAPAFRLDGS